MHYGSKKHLKKNILEVVFYKHEICDDGDDVDMDTPEPFKIELTSIHECRYVEPKVLQKFLVCYPYILKDEFIDLPFGSWHKFLIRWVLSFGEVDDFEVLSIENVSDSDNKFDRLH